MELPHNENQCHWHEFEKYRNMMDESIDVMIKEHKQQLNIYIESCKKKDQEIKDKNTINELYQQRLEKYMETKDRLIYKNNELIKKNQILINKNQKLINKIHEKENVDNKE